MIKVYSAMCCVDGVFLPDTPLPRSITTQMGDIVGFLTNLRGVDRPGAPPWAMEIRLDNGEKQVDIIMPIEAFLTPEEYRSSQVLPLCFTALTAVQASLASTETWIKKPPSWLWLFREGLYVTERQPRSSEMEFVALQIKALHFQRDEEIKRLREQVANFEATESYSRGTAQRTPLADDVKLLVWTRDGGACVKCGSNRDLHFDHIIPFSRGGSDEAENIQLLCRTCNLSKGAHLG